MSSISWPYSALLQSELITLVESLGTKGALEAIPVVDLGTRFHIGPYHMQIKNPKQGLFDIVESEDLLAGGFPALWHHQADKIQTMRTNGNAQLFKRANKNAIEQESMLLRQGRLQLALELRSTSQRLSAVMTKPMLGVRSWVTLLPKDSTATGVEETVCLWLNSSLGFLVRYLQSNRSYPGRSALVHELLSSLPILDTVSLSKKQLTRAKDLYEILCKKPLMPFKSMDRDANRRELDHRFLGEILGVDTDLTDSIAECLAREPMVHAQP